VRLGLEKQRSLVDDHLASAIGQLANSPQGELANSGVHDRRQSLSGLIIGEDHCSELLPIEGVIGAEHALAEALNDFVPSRLTRPDDFSGQLIRVNDVRPEPAQDRRDSAFARCDSSGQPHQFHGITGTYGMKEPAAQGGSTPELALPEKGVL
jgi:hypothetical protein